MMFGYVVNGAHFLMLFQIPWRKQIHSSLCVCVLQDVGVLRGAEGGDVDPQTPRKSSSSRSSRKSFRLDYRLEVKKKTHFPSSSCPLKLPPLPETHIPSSAFTSAHLKYPYFQNLDPSTCHLSSSLPV